MKRFVVILFAALSLVSCRKWVLEDRTDCPSFLYFDVTNAEKFDGFDDVYLNVYSHPKGLMMDEGNTPLSLIQTDNYEEKFFFTVRRTNVVKGFGLIGYEKLVADGSSWLLPLGWDFAPLFRFSYMENVEEESFIVPVEFVKEYCRVRFQFVGYETFHAAQGQFPFEVVIKSNTCGIEGLTGVAIRGPFEFHPEESSIGLFEFCLPRQGDGTLVMELHPIEGYFDNIDFDLPVLPLYDILRDQGGITWTEKNLPDVDIVYDYQEAEVTVTVSPWDSKDLDYEY